MEKEERVERVPGEILDNHLNIPPEVLDPNTLIPPSKFRFRRRASNAQEDLRPPCVYLILLNG